MSTAAEWQVGDLGTPPDPSNPPEGAPPPEATVAPEAPAAAPATDWTESDVAALKEVIRGPYDKLAITTGDDAYRLTQLDELLLVGSITTWMPASWARAGAHGNLPMIVALPLTALVLLGVNAPKLAHWNATRPELAIEIPIPFMRRPRRDRPREAPRDARGGGGGDQRAGGPSDRGQGAGDAAAAAPTASAADGGPPADTIDDVRRGYAAQ